MTATEYPAFTLPGMRLVNETNAREHWRTRAKRAKAQRTAAELATKGLYVVTLGRRLIVTITRLGPRKLDSDNLAASAKHVRDGIADAVGIDDGDERWTWLYAQERGPYGVRVEIVSHSG